ncbi:15819_t:CDS:2, partial [Cetraspora pellucida]
MPSLNDTPGLKPMTANNLIEQMNKSIEETSSQLVFETDMKRCLNQGHLYVLLHSVKPVFEKSDTYFYIKKGNGRFQSPYTIRKI